MNIPKQFLTNSLEHKYAGNGWAVVDAHKGEWMDVVYIGKGTVGSQLFRVWDKMMKPEGLTIEKQLLEKIVEIREKLASGEYVVSNTRLVKVGV